MRNRNITDTNKPADQCSQCSECTRWLPDQKALASHQEADHKEIRNDRTSPESTVEAHGRRKEDQEGSRGFGGSQTSTKTIDHEMNVHIHDGNKPKQPRRNSTRQARPESYRNGSDSEIEILQSKSKNSSHVEDGRLLRGVAAEAGSNPENAGIDSSRKLGGSATQGYICEICSEEFESLRNSERHCIVYCVCMQKGHIVNPSRVIRGHSHTPCERCAIHVKNSNLRDRNGNPIPKSTPRTNGGGKRAPDEVLQNAEGGLMNEQTSLGWRMIGHDGGSSLPRPGNWRAAGEGMTTRPWKL